LTEITGGHSNGTQGIDLMGLNGANLHARFGELVAEAGELHIRSRIFKGRSVPNNDAYLAAGLEEGKRLLGQHTAHRPVRCGIKAGSKPAGQAKNYSEA
jgi:hypothetical protein